MALITDARFPMEEMFVSKNFENGSSTPHIGIGKYNRQDIKEKFDDNDEDDATIEIDIEDCKSLHHSHTHFLLYDDSNEDYLDLSNLTKLRADIERSLSKTYF